MKEHKDEPIPEGWLTEGAIALSDYMALPAELRREMDEAARRISDQPRTLEDIESTARMQANAMQRIADGTFPGSKKKP